LIYCKSKQAYGGLFPPRNKKKSNCNFLSHNFDFITLNSKFISQFWAKLELRVINLKLQGKFVEILFIYKLSITVLNGEFLAIMN